MDRKILCLASIAFVLVTVNSYANVDLDLGVAYTQTGDLKSEYGFSATFLKDIHRDVRLFLTNIFNLQRSSSPIPGENDTYIYNMLLFGSEYRQQIMATPLYWSATAGLGFARGQYDYYSSDGQNLSAGEWGFCTSFWAGLLYSITQSISPYLKVGYHKAFYSADLDGASVGGMQVLFGLRITLTGKNHSIYDEY